MEEGEREQEKQNSRQRIYMLKPVNIAAHNGYLYFVLRSGVQPSSDDTCDEKQLTKKSL